MRDDADETLVNDGFDISLDALTVGTLDDKELTCTLITADENVSSLTALATDDVLIPRLFDNEEAVVIDVESDFEVELEIKLEIELDTLTGDEEFLEHADKIKNVNAQNIFTTETD